MIRVAQASNPYSRFIVGSGDATGLPSLSCDVIVCLQAFHWLDRDAALAEFSRLLVPGGNVLLAWGLE